MLNNPDPVLQITGLGIEKSGKAIVKDLSLSLAPGRFYGLLGPNGAGKTSVLKVLYRVDKALRGEIRFQGRPLADWPRQAYAARVSALIQESVSLAGLSIIEVVRLGLLPHRLSGSEVEARARQALATVELLERADEDAAHLSGGEKQRVFFAQLLAADPEIYLLDEPHNHLDLHYQYGLLAKVRGAGRTVLASFHDLDLACQYCDHVFLMENGRLVAEGHPEDVLTRTRLAATYRVAGQLDKGCLRITGAINQFENPSTKAILSAL